MKNDRIKNITRFFKKYYKYWTACLGFFLIALNYLIIINMTHNHLTFTNLMYIPVMMIGSVFGGFYGLLTGIVAGLIVGPLLPYNLSTGQPQYIIDWLFRMTMFSVIGLMSGLVSRNYRLARLGLMDSKMTHHDSGIHNLNYLRQLSLKPNTTYMSCTMMIENVEIITDVNGFEAYYQYLRRIKEKLFALYPQLIVVLPNINQLWLLTELEDMDLFVSRVLKEVQESSNQGDAKLFIDFALGFAARKYIKGSDISRHFIDSDLAAREAKSQYVTTLKYSDIKSNKQFEYELLTEFKDALYDGQIYMVYQPIIHLKNGKPKAIEALIRWEHPDKKMVSPDHFIPAVEKTTLIHDMTLRVFKWVLDYATRLQKKGIEIPVSINISTKNVYDNQFFYHMVNIFNNYTIKPSNVELEITESVLMDNPELSKRVLERFSTFGFRIAIDDFGKGYSSLAYLAQFPINVIKIDRIFTSQILINPATQAIVKATINLAKQLGYEVLIEGIEDKETADLLTAMGCDSAQGYYYMRPRKDTDILEFLLKQLKS